MRNLRFLGICLLTTVMAAAQTSTSAPAAAVTAPAAQSSTTSNDPNQTPTSPLEEPVKPTEADENKTKASTFDITGAGGSSQDQQLGEIRLMTRYTQLGGDVTRSFRQEGTNNLAEMNYFVDRSFLVTRRIQMLSMYRGTDDSSIDPERNSLQKAYVRIFGPRDEYIVGDALVNFSRLSFNQNIKGFSATTRIGENWKLSSVSGVFVDRYGSLYKDMTGEPYTAAVAGTRIERNVINKDSRFGLNFSSSNDLIGTLPTALVGTSPLPAMNNVATIDSKLQFKNGFRVESEYAYSITDFDRRTAGVCVAPCDTRLPQPTLDRTQGDWGARIEGSYRIGDFSFRSSYVRYQPNFASINARQIADLQDFVFRTSYDLTNWLTVDGTVRRSNNNLRDQLTFQTTLWGPEMKFILHDLPFYQRGVFEFGYRHRNVSASDASISRFVRTPYAEFTIPIKQTFLSIGYERRQAQDMIDPVQTSNTDRVYLGLRGVYDWKNWSINPGFRYELERQSHRPRMTAVPAEMKLDRDSNRLGSATLFIEAPRYFILEGAFRSSSATIFGPNGFSRPSYKAAATYKFRNDENMLFTFGFERYNNFYFTSPNYDERTWSGTILYRFGRKGQ